MVHAYLQHIRENVSKLWWQHPIVNQIELGRVQAEIKHWPLKCLADKSVQSAPILAVKIWYRFQLYFNSVIIHVSHFMH